jgi:hypothetical protein
MGRPHLLAATTQGRRRARLGLGFIALAVLTGLVSTTLVACGGPSRSVASYCSYLYDQGGQMRSRWNRVASATSQHPLAALGTVLSAPSELSGFLHQLSLRAPADISPEVQALSDAYKRIAEQQSAAVADPLGALASDFVEGLATSGIEQRFNQYSISHCGPPPGSQP